MQDVLAFQQSGDHGFPDRKRAEDPDAVGDGVVAGDPRAALNRAGFAGGQRREFSGVHRVVSLKSAPSYHAAARAVILPLLALLGACALLTGALQLAK